MATEFKVVMIGESNVGKSAIVFRSVHPTDDISTRPTLAVAFALKRVTTPSGSVIPLNLWDTAGSERFRSITRMYFKGSLAALLVFSLDSLESFEAASTYWIGELDRHVEPTCCIVLVGNKKDLVEERQVSFERANLFAASRNLPYVEVSAKTGEGIEDLFQMICQKLATSAQQTPPTPVLGSSSPASSSLPAPSKPTGIVPISPTTPATTGNQPTSPCC